MTDLTCPTCGHPVRVVSGDEGTNSYEPVEAPRDSGLDVERLARALRRLPDRHNASVEEFAEAIAAEYGSAPAPSGDLAAALTATPAEGPTILDAWQVIEREYPVATVERLHAALAATPADSLDAAWAEAEAALPEGWWLQLDHTSPRGQFRAQAGAGRWFKGYEPHGGFGPTPAAALRALAVRLRSQEAPEEPRDASS